MRLCLLLLAGAALTGCSHEARVLNPRVARAPVVFESPHAADTFEDALHDRYDDGAARIASRSGVLSQNAFFNREITHADQDGDGIISDHEALRYANGE
jgi:hypothetical protein